MNYTYVKQKLDELHLIDDFLFFQMMNHPKYGPKFSRLLLKLILGRDVGKLHVIPQKEYYGEDTDLHGARLDVYLEEEEPDFLLDFEDEGVPSVYDLEPEKKKDLESKDNLPKRVRFYHAVIDSHSLKSGKSYGNLMPVSPALKNSPTPCASWQPRLRPMARSTSCSRTAKHSGPTLPPIFAT